MTDTPRPAADAANPAANDSDPHAASPFRLDFERQRKRAKALLRALQAGDPEARERLQAQHPKRPSATDARLADAQLVVARELGLASWAKLKRHAEAQAAARQRLSVSRRRQDDDCETLHLRCGSDIEGGLREAGLAGDFLEYSNPFCQGPVPATPDWLERRADFIVAAYGYPLAPALETVIEGLRTEERRLAEAAARYERVVLWFEHDSYDQLVLARCLAAFAEQVPNRLEMVTLNRYPGGMRFIGLGQLPPESLLMLWEQRRPVTPDQVAEGAEVWRRLRSPDPRPLAEVARRRGSLPFMAPALRRHCQELPWLGDGLALTERLILRALADRPLTVSEIYRGLMLRYEPLPWMGDLMLLDPIERLREGSAPALALDGPADPERPFEERLALTPLGRSLLAGGVDWMTGEPRRERWVGGVPLGPGHADWRWDEAAESAVLATV